jgi:nitric oxide reductase large subunit
MGAANTAKTKRKKGTQLIISYDQGLWYACSAAFYELPIIQTLGNWRIVPDTIPIVFGAFPLLYFLISTFPRLRVVEDQEG